MIKKFILCWDVNKNKLKEYLSTHNQSEYSTYKDLVKLLFELIINPETEHVSGLLEYGAKFDTEHITIIDDGDYSGTQIFILHKDTYEPYIDDYISTHVYYGSCSGCDTLLGISNYEDGIPSEEQVDGYMTLCLHLLQHCRWMTDEEEEEK